MIHFYKHLSPLRMLYLGQHKKGQIMIDFSSALYLGLKHTKESLSSWQSLTTGMPSALYEPIQNYLLAKKIAQMQGLQMGVAAPSTLHVYIDLFHFFSRLNVALFIDEKIYPVSLYGIEQVMVKKIPVHYFKHLNARHLSYLISKHIYSQKIPVVLTDGWCPQCGKPAPVKDYQNLIEPYGGKLIIDDTQAFGVLGKRSKGNGYGNGGGGILQWSNAGAANITTVVSLAKAFGVPMAVISGKQTFLKAFVHNSETRASSSPVSNAHVAAGLHAININTISGNEKRVSLYNNVHHLKSELNRIGINLAGSLFPVQTINGLQPKKVFHLYKNLCSNGIKTVLVKGHLHPGPSLSIIIRADHSTEEIDKLANTIKQMKHLFPLSNSIQSNANPIYKRAS